MNIVPLSDHPSNSDKTSVIVWEDRRTVDIVWRVRGGYVASMGRLGAFDALFPTQDAASAAILAHRSTGGA